MKLVCATLWWMAIKRNKQEEQNVPRTKCRPAFLPVALQCGKATLTMDRARPVRVL